MKIAEALVQAKDIKGKVADLTRRIQADALFEQVEEGQEVPDISLLIEELITLTRNLGNLKSRIARTNAQRGLVDKINEMAQLRSLVAQLDSLSNNKQSTTKLRRIDFGEPHVKMNFVATYNVEEVSNCLEEMRSRIRALDLELQRLNWEVDLVD